MFLKTCDHRLHLGDFPNLCVDNAIDQRKGCCRQALLWFLATLGFGLYASWFGNYDAGYGSLGTVVVLLVWLYVSAYAVLIGGLTNAEIERQTASDTTTGPEEPIGQRGATMADTSAALQE
jgi:membrane protein